MDVAKVSKAIAGFLAGALVLWLTKRNLIISDELHNAVEVLIGAVVTGLVVFLAPKNKD